jgi:crotonobetainyl-CoA:carnitine CoA-transferase CaiB-like acyl-CoA transferase
VPADRASCPRAPNWRELPDMLSGYRVVELAIWVAGPASGGILADWGAEVIKVEAPSGDPMRRMFGAIGVEQDRVPPYELDNRGKRCVALDLTTDGGKADMDALLATADVFITNMRPDALERLGFDHESVRARFPRLVYASVTGYGLGGADRDRPGYDIGAFWARSSLAHSMVPTGEYPIPLKSGMGDHITAITITTGILAALLNRERTGEGRLVETSLLRAGTYVNGWDIGIRSYFGRIASARTHAQSQVPLLNCYRAADGKSFWLIGLEGDRHWPGLVAALGRPELREDERFRSGTARKKNSEALIAVLDDLFASATRDEWTARFDAHDVWWSPVNSIADVLEDPQAEAAGAWVEMPRDPAEPTAGTYRTAASPVSFSDYVQVPGPVHAVGEDTDDVLQALGR